MDTRKRFIALTALVFASASFSSAAADSFKVSASLSHKGKPFATPTMIVKNDSPASIEVSGADGFKLTLTVTDMTSNKIKVATNLDSSHGTVSPILVVRPGQPATVTVGDIGLTLTVQRNDS